MDHAVFLRLARIRHLLLQNFGIGPRSGLAIGVPHSHSPLCAVFSFTATAVRGFATGAGDGPALANSLTSDRGSSPFGYL